YLIGSSYYDQILDVSRDQARADKAIDALQEVVQKYPTSEYANSAQKKIAAARDQIAGKEMDVGRFYLNKRDFIGAINRFKVVVTQFQTTRHVEEALMRLSEAYVALGIIDEAQTAAAVLGHNFPDIDPSSLNRHLASAIMLARLSIRDIVLIDRLDIDFGSGLAVLTGETGAGKSILLDAFALALGARGEAALVREGAEHGQVIAAFEIGQDHPARRLIADNGLSSEDELI